MTENPTYASSFYCYIIYIYNRGLNWDLLCVGGGALWYQAYIYIYIYIYNKSLWIKVSAKLLNGNVNI